MYIVGYLYDTYMYIATVDCYSVILVDIEYYPYIYYLTYQVVLARQKIIYI